MIELQSVWGWQPALYLFLGGMGAGAFAMAALLYIRRGDELRKTASASAWASVGCLVVGLLCLLTELTNPLRGLMLWQSFSNMGSWMAIGAWVLVAAMAVFGLFALFSTVSVEGALTRLWKAFPAKRAAIMRVLSVLGIGLGVCVAAYTGILLMMAPGVPLWNTPLLPCLFTVSGIDTGVALVEIVSLIIGKRETMPQRDRSLMAKLVAILVMCEAVLLVAMLASLWQAGANAVATSGAAVGARSVGLLVSGQLAPWFWGLLVLCGLAVPLAASVVELTRNGASKGLPGTKEGMGDSRREKATAIGAIGALVGGCALRFLIVMAGLHADPVASTVEQLFSDLVARL